MVIFTTIFCVGIFFPNGMKVIPNCVIGTFILYVNKKEKKNIIGNKNTKAKYGRDIYPYFALTQHIFYVVFY